MILLVDDDEDILQATAELLRHCSYAVQIARSLAQAMEILDGGEIDLLVTDFDLGWEGTADEILDHAATRWPRVRRIVFSGSSIPAGVRAHAVVDKPDLEALLGVIRAIGDDDPA